MTQVDTPDYQRGVISAQKLLGTIAAGDTSATVGVPPNAETIVCMVKDQASSEGAYCVGASTGLVYPSGAIVLSVGATNTVTVWFDVSGAVDDQVTVNLFSAATGTTYIYSDSAVHTTNDPVTVDVLHGAMDNSNNAMYVIPRPPSTAGADHPPVELAFTAGIAAPPVSLKDAPGAGLRIRVMSAQLAPAAGSGLYYLMAASTGTGFLVAAPGTTSSQLFYPAGLALPENSGISLASSGASNLCAMTATFTIETV